jgi:hypothetical protein
MTTRKPLFGFRIVGNTAKRRRPVHAAVALAAYAACDPQAEVHREGYLSSFWFTADFHDYLRETGSPRDFRGVCWSPYIWWDVDRNGDLQGALIETRRLAATLDERYRLPDNALLLFHSGYKGFHTGLPTSLWRPAPSADFNRIAREFASGLAALAGLSVYDPKRGYRIDESIYDQVRPFRAPNSLHPKSGRYKRFFTFEELMGLSLDRVLQMAQQPYPFAPPGPYRPVRTGAAGLAGGRAAGARAGRSERATPRRPGEWDADPQQVDVGVYPRGSSRRRSPPLALQCRGQPEGVRLSARTGPCIVDRDGTGQWATTRRGTTADRLWTETRG